MPTTFAWEDNKKPAFHSDTELDKESKLAFLKKSIDIMTQEHKNLGGKLETPPEKKRVSRQAVSPKGRR